MLRMGKKFTNEEKYARVEEVLNEVKSFIYFTNKLFKNKNNQIKIVKP